MPILALSAAIGASLCWAVGSLIAHRPASLLGAFELTRTQLISSFALLFVIVTALGGWSSITWQYWWAFGVASVTGVVLANLAMFACMRRGGPRRSLLLVSMNAPLAAILSFVVLGETFSLVKLLGASLAFAGVIMAIFFGGNRKNRFDAIEGSLFIVVVTGLFSAACNALGLVVLKPALLAGSDPLAVAALRTGGGAFILSVIALWPMSAVEPRTTRTPGLVIQAVVPGFLGYVIAVSLQLYALRYLEVGLAAVLSSVAPVLMLPLIWATTGLRPSLLAGLGAGFVVAGTSVIVIG